MGNAKLFAFVLLVLITGCTGAGTRNKPVSGLPPADTAVRQDVRNAGPDNYLIDETENQDKGPVYMYCEKMPEFPGGEPEFQRFVMRNVKYPAAAVADKSEGRVIVKFIIRETGMLSDIRILHGIRQDLNDECLRVMGLMPAWKPGMIEGKPVSVSYSVPVRFLLKRSENLSGIYILPWK